ncbi:hypothetical protein PsorP6_005328 [Peronosclerospora sorghi]|uniref:Uncharacterized protein n=1 Tax=Peronosclerospora sorghi TaxID=230839 RepID=A0ACC0W4Y5_9STRA|nr:hypothetical protein PsorP6_005328 [Peronosclerospora sorghi]
MSPLSLKVTLEQMCQGSVKTYAECFQMEYRVATRMIENPDFFEGVRAVVVDKDRNPKWTKRDITKVTAEKCIYQVLGATHLTDAMHAQLSQAHINGANACVCRQNRTNRGTTAGVLAHRKLLDVHIVTTCKIFHQER